MLMAESNQYPGMWSNAGVDFGSTSFSYILINDLSEYILNSGVDFGSTTFSYILNNDLSEYILNSWINRYVGDTIWCDISSSFMDIIITLKDETNSAGDCLRPNKLMLNFLPDFRIYREVIERIDNMKDL